MSTYYCNSCAKKNGLIVSIPVAQNLTGSNYQVGKFIKHTCIPTQSGTISIFNTPDYKNYENYVINANASGSVEKQSNGKISYILYAGLNMGFEYRDGVFIQPVDAVKVVVTYDLSKIHAYPTSSKGIRSSNCFNCGNPILI